jgi:hypothetical protein
MSAVRLGQRAAERDHLAQRGWDIRADRLDQLVISARVARARSR